MEVLKKINNKYFKYKVTEESMRLGAILAIAGGFLDAYSYIVCDGVFANAQTGNIAIFGMAISKLDFEKAIFALLPIISCFLGILTSAYIKNNDKINYKSEELILVLEIIILAILSLFAYDLHQRVIVVIISYISSVQINSFRKLVDSPYCTTMCTGNLRTATENLYIGCKNKDEVAIKKALRLYVIIFLFAVGAAVGALLSNYFNEKALWFVVITLTFGVIMFIIDGKRGER